MDPAEFAPYRLTDHTVIRQPQEGFDPTYTVSSDVHERLRRIERIDQQLEGRRMEPAAAALLRRDVEARNAFATASIEGNPLSLTQVESLLAAPPVTPAPPHEQEILNHDAFMEDLAAWDLPRTPDDVAAIHARLMEGVLPDAGQWKEHINFIGDRDRRVVFVASPPGRVVPELEALLAWLHDAPEHPLVKTCVFFQELQAIHPFRDGNGRVGRMLSWILLQGFGYTNAAYAPIDYGFWQDRPAYYQALQDAQQTPDVTPWLDHMTSVIADAYEIGLRRFLTLDKAPALNPRQLRVVEWFRRQYDIDPLRRVKIADVHAALPNVARRTLQADLRMLVEAGVLDRKGERKGTTYRFDG